MKSYEITYIETLVHTFYVDADSKSAARNAFDAQCNDGQIDFSDGHVVDSRVTCVKECK